MEKRFLYGTLRDVSLLERVLGHRLGADQMVAAALAGHAVRGAAGQGFALLRAEPGQEAAGLLVRGLSAGDVARLDFYGGGFGFGLKTVRVRSKTGGGETAQIYTPPAGKWAAGDRWHLAGWQAEWGAIALQAAVEAMAYFGRITPAELARRMPMIRRRAASFLRAAAPAPGPGLGREMRRADVEVLSREIPYSNFFAMQEFTLKFRRFAGDLSAPVARAAFIGSDAAIVLPYDARRDWVLLVEQFRFGCFARGAERPWSLEPVAGHVEAGETPEAAARRETSEECGVTLERLEKIAFYYPSPGASAEYYFSYLGLCDLGDVGGGIGGLACENEDIRRHVIPFGQLLELVERGEAENAPLILATHWLARHRDRLRADWVRMAGKDGGKEAGKGA